MDNLYLLVQNQFPEFVRADYQVFVAFVQQYYKWLDQQGIGKLENVVDLDTTPSQFVRYFRTQLDVYGLFNDSTSFDKRYLKKIKQIYDAKGSEQALVNLLRLVYEAETTIKYPVNNILKASDGKWSQENYITVEAIFGTLPASFNNFYIVRSYDATRVTVSRFEVLSPTTVRLYYKMQLNVSVSVTQRIEIRNSSGVALYAGTVVRAPSYIQIVNGGLNWQLGQVITFPGTYVNTVARVAAVSSEGAITQIEILQHGYNHGENDILIISPNLNIEPTTVDLSIEELTGPPRIHYTLAIADGIDGATDTVTGTWSGVRSGPAFQTNTTDHATLMFKYGIVTSTVGHWLDESGQPSNQNIRLQDNLYYQQFSYDIESNVNSNLYINLAKAIHPAGMKLFTTYGLSEDIVISPIGTTSFPFIKTYPIDIAVTAEEVVLHMAKSRADTATASETMVLTAHKYLADAASVNADGTPSVASSTYDSQTYFAEDYAQIGKTLTLGV